METLPRTADAVVVGGGIVGTAVARALAGDGLKTVLVESRSIGGAVTGASLACLGTHMHGIEEAANLIEATRLWAEAAEALANPFEYRRCGQIRFVLDERDLPVARRWVEGERGAGLRPELLDPAALREIEPLLTGPIVAATWSPDDAVVNPFLAVRALLADARRRGASVADRTQVLGLTVRGGEICGVRTAEGAVSAPHVVLAAGPWTARLAATAGLSLPILPRQAQCLASTRQPPSVRTVVGACEAEGGVEAGYTQIQQAASGQILFNTVAAGGLSGEGAQDTAPEVSRGFVADSVAMLLTLFPSLSAIHLLRSWVRFEAVTPDGRFLAGPTPIGGLLVAAGDNGSGYCRALLLAELLRAAIAGRPSPGGAMYDPARFPLELA